MNKALHVLVYLFLILAGAALWFELQLNAKRSLLTDRNRLQEDYLIKIAGTIEKETSEKEAPLELKLDVSTIEAKEIVPDYENVLEDYNNYLETQNLPTVTLSKEQLRKVYVLDAEGNPEMDGNQPRMDGPGTEKAALEDLLSAASAQRSRLNTTRSELEKLRGKLNDAIDDLNKIKPLARKDKVTIEEKKAQIAKLEEEKTQLEDTVTKKSAQIEELKADVASKTDEINTLKDDIAAREEELTKRQNTIDSLKKLLADALQQQRTAAGGGGNGGTAVTSLPHGDKGVIVEANNELMYAIVKFDDAALKELKGGNPDAMLPSLELSVRRTGFSGQAGEFVGRLKIRQEVKGKPFVICDILGNWKQSDLEKNDVVFAD